MSAAAGAAMAHVAASCVRAGACSRGYAQTLKLLQELIFLCGWMVPESAR
jgi:hypothetical protein